jgi:Winged helix DNA-binding domain
MKALIGLKGTKLAALKWHQVYAWRLSQHGLSPRLDSQDVVQAVTRTGGIQAQVMSAAELALCTRVEGLSAQEIRSALWQDHTLVKTWAMRATLHVLATRDLPLYVAALNFRDFRNWPAYFAYYGLSPAQHEAFLSAVPQVLGRVGTSAGTERTRHARPDRSGSVKCFFYMCDSFSGLAMRRTVEMRPASTSIASTRKALPPVRKMVAG